MTGKDWVSMKKLTLPLREEDIKGLKAGDSVLLTGSMLTGRDAAHKRLYELIEQGKELPVDIQGETIYYVGPAPAKPGHAVGRALQRGNRRDCKKRRRLFRRNRRRGRADCKKHQKRGAFMLRGFGDGSSQALCGRGLPLHCRRRQRRQQYLRDAAAPL